MREFLRRGYAVVLWDFRGFGFSSGEPDLFRLVDDAVAVVDTLPESVPIVPYGPSLGSLVALGVAGRRPDRVMAAVLESAFVPNDVARTQLGGFRAALLKLVS
ncbi:MAG: alpha/beta fold hydrolase, partial [Pseudomonadota bacterium]